MKKKIKETLRAIRKKTHMRPQIAIALGSGFGSIAEKIDIETNLSYAQIPHFKKVGVQTHAGRLITGNFSGKQVVIMQGRYHLYEGHDIRDVVYPTVIVAALGATKLVTTNLSGGINKQLRVGDFMIIEDHINLSGANPLVGFNGKKDEFFFQDMVDAYSPRLMNSLKKCAVQEKIKLRKGTLAYCSGPSFETPAELRFLKKAGADAVGWSIVPEVLMARRLKIEVAGITCISDITDPDNPQPVNVPSIFNVGRKRAGQLHRLLSRFLSGLT